MSTAAVVVYRKARLLDEDFLCGAGGVADDVEARAGVGEATAGEVVDG